jgi:hypothetical protein
MTAILYQGTIQFRRGSAAAWAAANPVLLQGEMGVELDTHLFKIGDGVTAYSGLSYGGLQGAAGANGANGANGHGATTTTGGFAIVAAGGSATAPLSDPTAFPVGAYCVVSDGSHAILGQVSTLTGNNATIGVLLVVAGSVGDTIASGAVVTFSGPPGAGAALLAAQNVFTKAQTVTPVINNAVAGSITPDATASNNFRYLVTGNVTLVTPSGPSDGQVLNFRLKQDGTGGHTIAWPSSFKFAGGTAPSLSTAANAIDFLSAYYDATDGTYVCAFQQGLA